MILIQSASDDFSTSAVIQWLHNENEKFLRLNNKSIVTKMTILEDFFQIHIENREIKLHKIKSYWYRRGFFSIENNTTDLNIPNTFKDYLKNEKKIVLNFLNNYFLTKVRSISNFQTSKNNKIIACEIAKKYKLRVPNYLITTNKDGLIDFYNNHSKIITKSIYGMPNFKVENINFDAKTKVIIKDYIDNSPDTFEISLFQEYIEKKIELRVFFLNNDFYASAIFSQNDETTSIDFRNYNRIKPNRVVPYKLPSDIIEKLKNINKELSLNSGSYDLILTSQNEFCFLEVNPIGQFSQVSLPCNYYLEKKIATFLSNE